MVIRPRVPWALVAIPIWIGGCAQVLGLGKYGEAPDGGLAYAPLDAGVDGILYPMGEGGSAREAGSATDADAAKTSDSSAPSVDASSDAPPSDAGTGDGGNTTIDSSPGCNGNAGYRALVLCDQPVAYWRLGESGPSTALDEVAGGPVGVYDSNRAGGIQYRVPGAIVGDSNGAIHLNGTTSVTAGTMLEFAGMTAFSLEAWVKPDVVDANYRGFLSRVAWSNSGRVGYNLWSQTSGFAAERYSGTGATQEALDTAVLPTATYSHMVATYDGSVLSSYQNGTLVSSLLMQLSMNTVQTPFSIGDAPFVGSPWIGSIDEAAVYAHPLSAAQVALHHRVGIGH